MRRPAIALKKLSKTKDCVELCGLCPNPKHDKNQPRNDLTCSGQMGIYRCHCNRCGHTWTMTIKKKTEEKNAS